MKKIFFAFIVVLYAISCSANQEKKEQCFRTALQFYYVAPQCVDASVYWHSTVERHKDSSSGITVDEFVIDQEWWGILEGRSPVSSVLLIGTGALDEVPKILVVSSGEIEWKKKGEKIDSEGVRGIVVPVIVDGKTMVLSILENFKVFIDSNEIE